MAIRSILSEGDPTLRKKSRKVDIIDARIHTLLDDMAETMRKADGVGLAAPQVGILRRVVTIDIGEGLLELINPVIVKYSGKELDEEGCLSVPNKWGMVYRPTTMLVRARDRHGNLVEINADKALARVISHEVDHLDGVLFVDKVERYIDPEAREHSEEKRA